MWDGKVIYNHHAYWVSAVGGVSLLGVYGQTRKLCIFFARAIRVYEQDIGPSPFEDDIIHVGDRTGKVTVKWVVRLGWCRLAAVRSQTAHRRQPAGQSGLL